MRTVTLSELRTRALRLADLENSSSWVTNAEVDDYINEAVAKWWDIIASSQAHEWFKEWYLSQTEPDIDTYPLDPAPQGWQITTPSQRFHSNTRFYKLLGIDVLDGDLPRLDSGNPKLTRSSSGYISLPRTMRKVGLKSFMNNERNWPRDIEGSDYTWNLVEPRYRISGSVYTGSGFLGPAASLSSALASQRTAYVTFIPAPETTYWFRVWYLPHAPLLSADGDSLTTINGWEEYIVADVAAKLLIKEESDPSGALSIKQEVEASIRDSSDEQDVSALDCVQDYYRNTVSDFYNSLSAGTKWCSISEFDAAEQEAVSVSVQPPSATVPYLGTQQFTASAVHSDGSTRDISNSPQLVWETSDPTIATVDASGLATAIGLAGGTITVTAYYTTICNCTEEPLANITVTPADAQVGLGPVQMTATGLYGFGSGYVDVTSSVSWTSSNESLMTIDASGLVTVLGAGTVTITATGTCGISGNTTLNAVP